MARTAGGWSGSAARRCGSNLARTGRMAPTRDDRTWRGTEVTSAARGARMARAGRRRSDLSAPSGGEQFETEGIRQVELDVFADPRGGLFGRRGGLALIGEDPNSGIPELDQPGFRMMPVEDPAFGTGYVVRIPGGMRAAAL